MSISKRFLRAALAMTFAGALSLPAVASTRAYSHTVTVFHSPKTVRNAQRTLRAEGFYSGPVDGRVGSSTRRAIRRFQRANNLRATGNLDPMTLKLLNRRG